NRGDRQEEEHADLHASATGNEGDAHDRVDRDEEHRDDTKGEVVVERRLPRPPGERQLLAGRVDVAGWRVAVAYPGEPAQHGHGDAVPDRRQQLLLAYRRGVE